MGDSNLGEVVTTPELGHTINNVSVPKNVVKKLNLSLGKFDGKVFYEKYKNASFFKENRNITRILSQYREIFTVLATMRAGEKLVIDGMFIVPGVPLIITKSGTIDQSDVDNDELTLLQLMGLTAAYVWNNSDAFEGIYASEPEDLGLCWTSTKWHRKLYLSAVSGAELFLEFEYLPFLCALKKYSMKRIPENILLYIAKKPHPDNGEPMAVWYRRKFSASESYNNKLFRPEHSWQMATFVYNVAPPSVQFYLKNLGNV